MRKDSKMKIKILLADDHIVMRDGLSSFLEQQEDFEIIGKSGEGQETIQMAQHLKPDVIVMDINMPNMNGIEATRQIKTILPNIKIITLSVYTRTALVAQMLKAGASGYLPKNSTCRELVESIRAVMKNKTYISSKVIDSVVAYLHRDESVSKNETKTLTPRERQVLCFISEGKSTKEIANTLFLSEKTIETHRYNIMQKLDIHKVTDLIKYAISNGIIPMDFDEL